MTVPSPPTPARSRARVLPLPHRPGRAPDPGQAPAPAPGAAQAPARRPHRGRAGGRVPALDGLRALAVALVVVYHLAPQIAPSGLIGVDVFFVLSGYLITAGLLREKDAGRVDLRGFWQRRARRILPAIVVLLLVIGASLLVVGGDASVELGRQMAAALVFASNWSLIAAGDDYFLQSSPPVLQNLWSLAVEEQFYLVWPVLLLVVVWAARRRAHAVVIALALASLVWGEAAVGLMGTSRAYFGTDTHGFGLLAGAALAIFRGSMDAGARGDARARRIARTRDPGRRRAAEVRSIGARHAGSPAAARGRALRGVLVPCATMLATGMLVLLALVVPEARAFTWASPLAVVLSCVVIAGCSARAPGGGLLALPPLTAVGRRSFGIYLWHWPLIVITSQLLPVATPAWVAPAVAIAGTVVAAWTSFALIERPIMRDGFRGARAHLRRAHGRLARGAAVAAVGALACAAVGAAVVAPTRTAAEQQIAAGAAATQASSAGAGEPEPDATTSTDDGVAASDGGGSAAPEEEGDGDRSRDEHETTREGPPPGREILAIGDSVMLASAPALVDRFPGIRIDAKVSRMPSEAPGILSALADSGDLRSTVVIGLGTNGAFSPDTLHEIRRVLGPDRTLVLVTAYADRSWEQGVNEALEAFAAQDPHTEIADWHAAISEHPRDLGPDRVHPGQAGAEVYTDAVVTALGGRSGG